MKLLKRALSKEFMLSAKSYPIVTLTGPRQSGKTTFAKMNFHKKIYKNLELPDIHQFAKTDPQGFLDEIKEGAILDEIQRIPELLSYLQVYVDSHTKKGQFILTGSHQISLHEGISQSLAGRTGILHLLPFSLNELQQDCGNFSLNEQLFNGGYPRIYKDKIEPHRFYRDYVQTYLERDVRQIINVKDLEQFQRFLHLCAARTGHLIDYTSIANDLGISRFAVKEWISVLKASYLVFSLQPYFENFGKRIIKSSKLYFTDVGLLCYLLGIREHHQLTYHPLRGQLFENLIILELLKAQLNMGHEPHFYFYRDNHQNEIDVLLQQANELIAIEIKSAQTFHPSFLKTLRELKTMATRHKLRRFVVYTGTHQQKIDDIYVLNYKNLADIF